MGEQLVCSEPSGLGSSNAQIDAGVVMAKVELEEGATALFELHQFPNVINRLVGPPKHWRHWPCISRRRVVISCSIR